MDFDKAIEKMIEILTPERCMEIAETIKKYPDAYFGMFPNPELARQVFAEEAEKYDSLDALLELLNSYVAKLEHGKAEQDDVDQIAYAVFRCILINPDQKSRIIGLVTTMRQKVENNPMIANVTDENELEFWNKLAIEGVLYRHGLKNAKMDVIPGTYEKVKVLARTLRDMILSEEENAEIGLDVKIVPEKPIAERDTDGSVLYPDTAAWIKITTNDAIQLTSETKSQMESVISSATECNATSVGIIANGEYGISANIFCNIPTFSWTKSDLEDII